MEAVASKVPRNSLVKFAGTPQNCKKKFTDILRRLCDAVREGNP
jgi:hypothetical protein